MFLLQKKISVKLINRISLFFILLYIFMVPSFLSKLAEINFGIKILEFYPYIFFLIPVLSILGPKILNKNIVLPHFGSFFAVLFFFLLLESNLFRGDVVIDLKYIYVLTIIYTCFLVLVNYGTTSVYRDRIMKYSIVIVLGIAFTTLLGYFEVINIGYSFELLYNKSLATNRFISESIHPNGQSFTCTVVIFILIICRKENRFGLHKGYLFWALILIMFSIIILNASRGAFVISMAGLLVSINKIVSLNTLKAKYLLFIFLIGLSFLFIYNSFEELIKNVYVFTRLLEETNFRSARVSGMLLSWNNFTNNIWFGTGYHNASLGYWEGSFYTRSNFSYFQILASHGIFYFIIYMYFLYKMFGINIRRHITLLVVIGTYFPLMFYNLSILVPISIFAYLFYYYKKHDYISIRLTN